MKKNFRKPLKSLMLTAMALLTATATAVNATSYVTIKVEHIWEDNNNAYGTRPDEVTVDITQVQGKDQDGKDQVINDDFTEVTDNGSTAGKEAGAGAADKSAEDLLEEIRQKGEEAGIQAGAGVKDKLEDLDLEDPSELKDPADWKDPDALPKPEDLKDFTGEDGKEYTYDEAAKKEYAEKLEEYRQAYDKDKGSEDQQGSREAYKKAYEDFCDYLKEYFKGENSASRPGGNDSGFMGGFLEGFEGSKESELTPDQLKEAYENGFAGGYEAGYNGTAPSVPEIKDEERDQLVEEIGDQIDSYVEVGGDDMAKKIVDAVEEIIKGTEPENLWFEEKELAAGDEKDEHGNPLNYRADMDEHPVEAKKDFLKDTLGLDDEALKNIGYTTKQLKIEITIVDGRVYVSVNGGKSFTGVDTNEEYDEEKDVLEEVKFTFLHTLNVPYNPPPVEPVEDEWDIPSAPDPSPKSPSENPPKEPENPPEESENPPKESENPPEDPENSIPEDGVPLANFEKEPEEEEIPPTEVPKTGDSSLLWMCAAMFSGMALLVLLKKEKEAQKA